MHAVRVYMYKSTFINNMGMMHRFFDFTHGKKHIHELLVHICVHMCACVYSTHLHKMFIRTGHYELVFIYSKAHVATASTWNPRHNKVLVTRKVCPSLVIKSSEIMKLE